MNTREHLITQLDAINFYRLIISRSISKLGKLINPTYYYYFLSIYESFTTINWSSPARPLYQSIETYKSISQYK